MKKARQVEQAPPPVEYAPPPPVTRAGVMASQLSALLPLGSLVWIYPRAGSPGVITAIASRFGEVAGAPVVRVAGFDSPASWLAVALVNEPARRAKVRREDARIAGGGASCRHCGRELREHPADPDARFLRVLCDLSRVKL